jgi:hypothetical protein
MREGDLPLRWQAWRLPKRGNSEAECEDAWAAEPAAGRFAIADGASESAFAYLWAKMLVEEFVTKPVAGPHQWTTWLAPVQQAWLAEVSHRPLPWYIEAKVQEGAFAAFLGLCVSSGRVQGQQRWRAIAVGDSCLFLIRGGRLHQAFPLQRSDDFGNCPLLVGSRGRAGTLPEKDKVTRKHGSWQAGDQLWLMSDALAQWFLRQTEADRQPWQAVGRLLADSPTVEAFAGWIDELRDTEDLRNDDVTLIAVGL